MPEFTELYLQLEAADARTRIELLADHWQAPNVGDSDKVWGIYLLSGGKLNQIMKVEELIHLGLSQTSFSGEFFELVNAEVGDKLETLAGIVGAIPDRDINLIDDAGTSHSLSLTELCESLMQLASSTEVTKTNFIYHHWGRMPVDQRYVFNLLIIGKLRLHLGDNVFVKSLNTAFDLNLHSESKVLVQPGQTSWSELLANLAAHHAPSPATRHTMQLTLLYLKPARGGKWEFTLGQKSGDNWIPITSVIGDDLPTQRLTEILTWARKHTLQRFGSTLMLEPQLEFTVTHAGTRPAPRRKSGIELIDPQMEN